MKKTFSKTLSANDVGATGGHQGGMLIPKTETELLEFLPKLDAAVKNPDAWIVCSDENGSERRFRYVYYNNRLHDEGGTRNEYRITYMTAYFRSVRASEGDTFEISRREGDAEYLIKVSRVADKVSEPLGEYGIKIKLSSAWRRVH